ncbi:MAG: hypothetical protein GQ477_02815 [Nanohaloarchaea archaeon]|nr:hypothetical protein [Candidatus Nanohaloarchaea archaeon]
MFNYVAIGYSDSEIETLQKRIDLEGSITALKTIAEIQTSLMNIMELTTIRLQHVDVLVVMTRMKEQ